VTIARLAVNDIQGPAGAPLDRRKLTGATLPGSPIPSLQLIPRLCTEAAG
jgi:hypothetical protein